MKTRTWSSFGCQTMQTPPSERTTLLLKTNGYCGRRRLDSRQFFIFLWMSSLFYHDSIVNKYLQSVKDKHADSNRFAQSSSKALIYGRLIPIKYIQTDSYELLLKLSLSWNDGKRAYHRKSSSLYSSVSIFLLGPIFLHSAGRRLDSRRVVTKWRWSAQSHLGYSESDLPHGVRD